MYMQDTCMIHARLIKDTCGIKYVSAVVRGYMRDTCGILQRYILGFCQMYPESRYVSEMQDPGYMRDTCEIHEGYLYPQG